MIERRIRAQARALFEAPRIVLPAGWELFWRVFLDLHDTRGEGFSGPLPITFVEIEAYARLHRLPLQPSHVGIIRAIDRAWLERPGTGMNAATGASTAVTPSAFDAVFG